jgi:hypothetical protein
MISPIINPLTSGKPMMETFKDYKEEVGPFYEFSG